MGQVEEADQQESSTVNWLLAAKDKKLSGSFHFPRNESGPDILFALKSEIDTDGLDTIICAVQASFSTCVERAKVLT